MARVNIRHAGKDYPYYIPVNLIPRFGECCKTESDDPEATMLLPPGFPCLCGVDIGEDTCDD